MELLDCPIQNYPWGDHGSISALAGRGPSEQPEAEMWIGANPVAPSRLVSSGQRLDEVIAEAPDIHLGAGVVDRFGELPFLVKVLAAAEPLSIQVHPTAEQARAGFEREEASGLDRLAPNRNYRDPNPKAELICALTPFEARCGFREVEATLEFLDAIGDGRLAGLVGRLGEGLEGAVGWLLSLRSEAVEPLVAALVDSDPVSGYEAEQAWVAPMVDRFGVDVGVVMAALMNHIVLQPGEGMFLSPGQMHSYLRGTGVEIMSNSDNVIRGGLTPKHLDAAELMRIGSFVPSAPRILAPDGPLHTYEAPVADFSLTRVVGPAAVRLEVAGPELILVTEGSFEITGPEGAVTLGPGRAGFVSAGDRSYLLVGRGQAWRATVGEI